MPTLCECVLNCIDPVIDNTLRPGPGGGLYVPEVVLVGNDGVTITSDGEVNSPFVFDVDLAAGPNQLSYFVGTAPNRSLLTRLFFTAGDGITIFGAGNEGTPLDVDVRLSDSISNIAQFDASGGLLVDESDIRSSVNFVGGTATDHVGIGTVASPHRYDVRVSPAADNLLVVNGSNQLYVAPSGGGDVFVSSASLVAPSTLRLTRNDAVNLDVDLSTLVAGDDLHITAATLVGTTLRITRSDAAQFDVPLAGINTDTNNYVTGVTRNSNTNALTFARQGLGELTVGLSQPNMGSPFVVGQVVNSGNDNIGLWFNGASGYGPSINDFWSVGLPNRIYPVSGRYIITAWIEFTYTAVEPATDANVRMWIERIGPPSAYGIANFGTIDAGNTNQNRTGMTGHTYIQTGDYIRIRIDNFGAGNMTITNGFIELSRLM